jgi:hypothetical protein
MIPDDGMVISLPDQVNALVDALRIDRFGGIQGVRGKT